MRTCGYHLVIFTFVNKSEHAVTFIEKYSMTSHFAVFLSLSSYKSDDLKASKTSGDVFRSHAMFHFAKTRLDRNSTYWTLTRRPNEYSYSLSCRLAAEQQNSEQWQRRTFRPLFETSAFFNVFWAPCNTPTYCRYIDRSWSLSGAALTLRTSTNCPNVHYCCCCCCCWRHRCSIVVTYSEWRHAAFGSKVIIIVIIFILTPNWVKTA